MNYQEYLKSERWKKLRLEVIARDGGMCRLCSSTKNLEVHHRTYENLGSETGSDLTTMCGACHALYSAAAEVMKPYRNDRAPSDVRVNHLKDRIAALDVAQAEATTEKVAVDICIEKRILQRELEELTADTNPRRADR